MNVKLSLLFLGCGFICCKFCFYGIDAVSGPYNIAQGKPTHQGPKTWCGDTPRSCHPSEYAVDNDFGQNIAAGDCSHTDGDVSQGSWWSVDFQGKYYLSYIRILRRSDVKLREGDRMRGITIKGLSSSHIIYSADNAGVFNQKTDVNTTIPEQLKDAQFSGINISVSGRFLTLCEVQVFLDMDRYCIVPHLEHGTIMKKDQPVTAIVVPLNVILTYACDAGFTPFHQEQLECTVDGLRDNTNNAPICSVTKCGELSQIPNAIWTPSGSTCIQYGCFFTLKCDRGYTLNITGQITTTCDENGQWTDPKGRCEAKECPLEINTVVNYTIANHQEKYTYKDTLTAKCKDGHELSTGNLARFCLESGTWSGSEPVCTIVACQRPNEDPLLITKLNSSGSAFYYGTLIQTACVRGYKHTSGNLTRQRQAKKTWSASPVCKAIQCSAPSLVANGGYFQISKNGTEEEVFSSPIKFALDTRLHFKCDDGFALSYPCRATRVCLEDEKWSEEEPKCNEISSSNDKHLGDTGSLTALTGGIIGAGTVLLLMLIAVAVFLLLRRMRNHWHTDSAYESTVNVDGQRRYSTLDKTDRRSSDNGEPKVVPDRATNNDMEMYEEIGGKNTYGNFKV